jgi:hypothetical protein
VLDGAHINDMRIFNIYKAPRITDVKNGLNINLIKELVREAKEKQCRESNLGYESNISEIGHEKFYRHPRVSSLKYYLEGYFLAQNC